MRFTFSDSGLYVVEYMSVEDGDSGPCLLMLIADGDSRVYVLECMLIKYGDNGVFVLECVMVTDGYSGLYVLECMLVTYGDIMFYVLECMLITYSDSWEGETVVVFHLHVDGLGMAVVFLPVLEIDPG